MNKRGRKLALTINNPQRNVKSAKQEKNLSLKKSKSKEIYDSKEEISNELLSRILDTINSNSLNIFYPDSSSEFKKKIDALNLKFYLETEKYLSNKKKSEKCQTSLFIILFKQINIYIEEIERLNLVIIKKRYDPKNIIERTDEIIKKQNEFLTKEKLIKALKESKSNMESKLLESLINEDKLKKEIQNLKKENDNFKRQLLHKKSKNIIIKKNKLKKESPNTKNLLNKAAHQPFQLSTLNNLFHSRIENGIYGNNENNYYSQRFENGASPRKRNNSDNKEILLNNSFRKIEKNIELGFSKRNTVKGGKLLFKNFQKSKDNSNNISISNNNSHILKKHSPLTTSNHLNKKTIIHIKLNHDNENNYSNNYNQSNTQPTNISYSHLSNNDYNYIKPIKTEYLLSDLDNYKKGFQNENNIENNINKEKRIQFCNSNCKDKKDINIIEKNNLVNDKNKENMVSSLSKQISSVIGKNFKERKKI